MMKNNKGFTLIELLSTVVIIGILSVTAVLAVNRIIENVRKNNFVETAKSYANSARHLWVSDNVYCGSSNLTPSNIQDGDYYFLIDTENENFNNLLESGGKSSWGKRDMKGYVRVNVSGSDTGKRVTKFSVSITDGVHGLIDTKEAWDLGKSDMLMNMNDSKKTLKTISELPFVFGNATTCGDYGEGKDYVPRPIEINSADIDNPSVGDTFSISTQKFHIISSDEDTVTGLAYYNINAGNIYYFEPRKFEYITNKTYLQDSTMNGRIFGMNPDVRYGAIGFSDTNGDYATSKVKKAVDIYRAKLEEMGIDVIDARLITKNELINVLNCSTSTMSCPSSNPWVYSTSYWTQSASDKYSLWCVNSSGTLESRISYRFFDTYGVRPVITIKKSEIENNKNILSFS